MYLQLIIAAFITPGSRLKALCLSEEMLTISKCLSAFLPSAADFVRSSNQTPFTSVLISNTNRILHSVHSDIFLLVTQQQSHTSMLRVGEMCVEGKLHSDLQLSHSSAGLLCIHTNQQLLTVSCFYSTVLSPDSRWTFPHLAVTKDQ